MESAVVNMDDLAAKRALLSKLGTLRGEWRIELVKYRPRRSDRQNRFYWPAIVAPLAQRMAEDDYDVTTPEQAHEILKARFLTVPVVNKTTGEILGNRVRSTTELTTEEFADYVDRCAAFMADYFGIVVITEAA